MHTHVTHTHTYIHVRVHTNTCTHAHTHFILTHTHTQGVLQKEALLRHVLQWRERLEAQGSEVAGKGWGQERIELDQLPKSGPEWNRDLEQWLSALRMGGVSLSEKIYM